MLTATITVTGTGQLVKTLDVSNPTDQVDIGNNNFPELEISLTDGTGSNEATSWFTDERTVTAGSTDSIDLNGTLTGPLGDPINWTTVRVIVIAITVPDGIQILRVGPQGVADAAQLGFGGTGSQAYLETDNFLILARPWGGWGITAATADLLPVKNPTGVSVTYVIWAMGTP